MVVWRAARPIATAENGQKQTRQERLLLLIMLPQLTRLQRITPTCNHRLQASDSTYHTPAWPFFFSVSASRPGAEQEHPVVSVLRRLDAARAVGVGCDVGGLGSFAADGIE